MKLVSPAVKYRSSYIDMIQDFSSHDEIFVPFTLNEEYEDFARLVQRLEGYSKGDGVPEGFVEHQSYWLVNPENRVVGTSNMRLRLNEKLRKIGGHIGFGVMPSERGKGYATKVLAETLIRAQNVGIEKALLTCDKSNVASAQVIKKNGGIFHSEGPVSDYQGVIQRYWIQL